MVKRQSYYWFILTKRDALSYSYRLRLGNAAVCNNMLPCMPSILLSFTNK